MRFFRFGSDFLRACWTLVVPILLVMAVTIWLIIAGRYRLASAVGDLGAMLVLLANVVYIVAWHSRKRWPRTSWYVRLAKLFTFGR